MTGASKRKGDRAEREAATLLQAALGIPVRRLLGAGRHDDVGDLDVPGWTIQVADWDDLASALRSKPLDADRQAAETGNANYAAALLRLRGGDFRIAMTPTTFAHVYAALAQGRTPRG